MHHIKEAIADYSKAIELDPQSYASYNNRGNAELDQKNIKEAIADFDRAIKIKPDYAIAFCNRGLAYVEIKHYH
jgi:tetratricopeptide (TPR) repeat protein